MKNSTCIAILTLLFTLLLGSTTVMAQESICITLDESRDNLSEEEQKATVILAASAFSEIGMATVQSGCANSYTIYHVRLGESVTVHMEGPMGIKKMRVDTIEDLPSAYNQLARQSTGDTSDGAVTRDSVTTRQETGQHRQHVDNLVYAGLGLGLTAAPGVPFGPNFIFGYRYELDSIGIDLSFRARFDSDSENGTDGTGASASFLRLGVIHFFDPLSANTFYAGGALSYGGMWNQDGHDSYSGAGLQGEINGGYEMLRASKIRLSFEANAVLPFYTSKWDNYDNLFNTEPDIASKSSKWSPIFTLNILLAWGGEGD